MNQLTGTEAKEGSLASEHEKVILHRTLMVCREQLENDGYLKN